MALSVRLGTVPILWNNDDVPELTPLVSAAQVLAEMRQAGFEGTELGTNYPEALRSALGEACMVLSGGYFCADYADPSRHDAVVAAAEQKCERLAAAGAKYLIVADQLHPDRVAVAGRARGEHSYRPAQFNAMVDVLARICRVADRAGLAMVFHNHAGTHVETAAELDRFLYETDPAIGLCLDTGHYLFGDGEPVWAIKQYAKRLRYVHLKDVDGGALSAALHDRVGFLDCLRRRVFTEVGQGKLPLAGVLSSLAQVGYQGWLVCEQDTTWRAPLESASLSFKNLTAALAELA